MLPQRLVRTTIPSKTSLNLPAKSDVDMINDGPTSRQAQAVESTGRWRQSLAEAIRNPNGLLDYLGLSQRDVPQSRSAEAGFPILVPHSYAARMRRGDPLDPLLRQVLPVVDEESSPPGFAADAVGDVSSRRSPGLLHKYRGRALLIATGACAIHCRYCFRRHYPYGEEPRRLEDWQPALETIGNDDSLNEIILSGGDPLVLSDRRLHELVARLGELKHLRRLRIHTRLPVVLPDRVTPEFLDLLQETRLTSIVVVHANHPQELQSDCADAILRISASGIMVLNQAVLLRGINDDVGVLAELSERLVELGVRPYYLHQLDRVTGTSHFEVAEETGLRLIQQLRVRLPGYAVPQYVREVQDEPYKVPIV